MANRATVRKRTLHRRKRTSSAAKSTKRTGLKRPRAHARAKSSAPRISRARLRNLREDLDVTRDAVTDTVHKFWIIPEGDIRQTLTATQQKIGRAVEALRKAA